MHNQNNTIFLDLIATFFPERVRIIQNSNNEKLNQFNMLDYIHNSNADNVAITLFNDLNKRNDFTVVLLDTWLDEKLHKKEFMEELFNMNDLHLQLHDSWILPYTQKNTHSPLVAATEWIDNHTRDNYTVILDEYYKHLVEFSTNSAIDYNHSVFVNKQNGLSSNNIREIYKSIDLWY